MDQTSWLWIALIAFLVFCCAPMLFRGRQQGRSPDVPKEQDGKSGDSETT